MFELDFSSFSLFCLLHFTTGVLQLQPPSVHFRQESYAAKIFFFCGLMVFCQEEQNLGPLNYKFECLGGGEDAGAGLDSESEQLLQNRCCFCNIIHRIRQIPL